MAAANGHLDVAKWLHQNRAEGCTEYAMDAAARNGHLEVVQWLYLHQDEGSTIWGMDHPYPKSCCLWMPQLKRDFLMLSSGYTRMIWGGVQLMRWTSQRDMDISMSSSGYTTTKWQELVDQLTTLLRTTTLMLRVGYTVKRPALDKLFAVL